MMNSALNLFTAFMLIAAYRARANYLCVCDVNHPQGYIFDCPSRTQVIGAIYRPDDVLPYHGFDLQGPYCKPILSNVVAPDGFLAVLHNNQIGYLESDSGYMKGSCSGQASFNTALLNRSPNCNHNVTGPTGLTASKPLPTATVISTSSSKTTLPQHQPLGWLSVVQQNDIHCKGSSVQGAVDQGYTVFHSQARSCALHGASAPESVLIAFCNAPADLTRWKSGSQVVKHCPHISKYEAISKFDSNQLQSDYAGIFLECTATGGFKMIRQTCSSLKLEVVTIEVGVQGQYHDAEKYFVVY